MSAVTYAVTTTVATDDVTRHTRQPGSRPSQAEQTLQIGHPITRIRQPSDILIPVTRRTMNSTQRRLSVAAIALVSASALAGCGQTNNPFTTELQYDPADGVSKTLGDLTAQNLLIVNDGKAKTGKMEGLVYNKGSQDATLTVSLNGQNVDVKVPAGKSVRLDGKANGNGDGKASPVNISNLGDAKVGDQVNVTLKADKGGSTEAAVPVLLDQPPYGTAEPEHPEASEKSDSHGHGKH